MKQQEFSQLDASLFPPSAHQEWGEGTGLLVLSSITLPSYRFPGTYSGNLPLPFLARYIIYLHFGDQRSIFFLHEVGR